MTRPYILKFNLSKDTPPSLIHRTRYLNHPNMLKYRGNIKPKRWWNQRSKILSYINSRKKKSNYRYLFNFPIYLNQMIMDFNLNSIDFYKKKFTPCLNQIKLFQYDQKRINTRELTIHYRKYILNTITLKKEKKLDFIKKNSNLISYDNGYNIIVPNISNCCPIFDIVLNLWRYKNFRINEDDLPIYSYSYFVWYLGFPYIETEFDDDESDYYHSRT